MSPPQGLSEVLTHPEGTCDPTMLGAEPETEGGQQCLGWLGQTWGFQGKTKRCWVSEGPARVDYAKFTFGALIVIIFFSFRSFTQHMFRLEIGRLKEILSQDKEIVFNKSLQW